MPTPPSPTTTSLYVGRLSLGTALVAISDWREAGWEVADEIHLEERERWGGRERRGFDIKGNKTELLFHHHETTSKKTRDTYIHIVYIVSIQSKTTTAGR